MLVSTKDSLWGRAEGISDGRCLLFSRFERLRQTRPDGRYSAAGFAVA